MEKNRVNKTEIFDIGWLAGLFDGEGCVSIRPNGKTSWAYEINITNTSKVLIKKLRNILDSYQIKYFFGNPKRMSQKHPHWKERWDVRIIRRDCIEVFLDLVTNHLTAKKERAVILNKIIKSKKKRPHGFHYYTDYETKLIEKFRSLQRKPYKGNSEPS